MASNFSVVLASALMCDHLQGVKHYDARSLGVDPFSQVGDQQEAATYGDQVFDQG
jgi:hypothetical protein